MPRHEYKRNEYGGRSRPGAYNDLMPPLFSRSHPAFNDVIERRDDRRERDRRREEDRAEEQRGQEEAQRYEEGRRRREQERRAEVERGDEAFREAQRRADENRPRFPDHLRVPRDHHRRERQGDDYRYGGGDQGDQGSRGRRGGQDYDDYGSQDPYGTRDRGRFVRRSSGYSAVGSTRRRPSPSGYDYSTTSSGMVRRKRR